MRILALVLAALLAAVSPARAQTVTPQGRLTLLSGQSVMTADVTAATTLYWTCHVGNALQIAGTNLTIGGCQISMGLSAVNHVAGGIYDVFVKNDAGTAKLCTGPAWSSTTSRGAGAGTTEIHRASDGLWYNANSLTNCFGGVAGTDNLGTISADNGLYIGSMYATANGQTAMQLAPTPAAGGTNNFLALYNAYNRVPMRSMSIDSTVSWTYNSATWRSANNNASNRVTWLDGLQQSQVTATYVCGVQPAVNNSGIVGINFDSTSATPVGVLGYWFNANVASNVDDGTIAGGNTAILLGLHYAQGMESRNVGAGTTTFYGSPRQSVTLFMMN